MVRVLLYRWIKVGALTSRLVGSWQLVSEPRILVSQYKRKCWVKSCELVCWRPNLIFSVLWDNLKNCVASFSLFVQSVCLFVWVDSSLYLWISIGISLRKMNIIWLCLEWHKQGKWNWKGFNCSLAIKWLWICDCLNYYEVRGWWKS